MDKVHIERIMKVLPHRYPFLMVDRIIDFKAGEHLEAIKNVTINEPFFQGHFPGMPVMPGVLILEALAQSGGLLIDQSTPGVLDNKILMFTGMEKVRFRKPVVPGDQLILRCTDLRHKLKLWKINGTALVDGQVVAEALLTAAVLDREDA
ncbi:MAG: 3-hydroxyacyl-ACP dehydratase FabZ [Thermodesulfobacteriota bacterium]|nr:3-hydroxyacyl-ACP dehydratase FabZ [Thermodesulfobacteriota bacterium]